MVTQKDIAKKLKLSRATVSSILSGGESMLKFRPEIRCSVLDAARTMGYARNDLAFSLRTGRNNVIGFFCQNIEKEYSAQMLSGIEKNESDYFVKVFSISHEHDEHAVVEICLRQALSGVILYDEENYDFVLRLDAALKKNGIPLVVVAGCVNLEQGMRILSDMEQGGRAAFEYLYSTGRRNFIFLQHSWRLNSELAMLNGFRTAARKKNITVPDENIWYYDNNYSIEELYKHYMKLSPRPDALFCSSSFPALEIMNFFQIRGVRIPETLAVLARGNMAFTRSCYPRISVLDEKLFDIGRRAMNLLKERIKFNDLSPFLEYFPQEIIGRDSTAGAKGRF